MGTLFWVSYAILWLLLLAAVVAIFGLYQHFARIYLSSDEGRAEQGPTVGNPLPDIALVDKEGRAAILQVTGKPSVILFVSMSCPVCRRIQDELRGLTSQVSPVEYIILSGSTLDEAREWGRDLPATLLIDPSGKVTASLRIDAIPFCVSVASNGNVSARGIVNDLHGLELARIDAQAIPVVDVSK